LRREAGISPRIREIAIMTTAREFDSLFEWNAHEPEGLKEGVPPAVVDAIKNRKSLDGLDPTDAIVTQFGALLAWRFRPASGVARLMQSVPESPQSDIPVWTGILPRARIAPIRIRRRWDVSFGLSAIAILEKGLQG